MEKSQAVPVRWMAPETLRQMKFSTASDVWAYGVTIWEIYTFGKKPYSLIPRNEDIVFEVIDGLTLDIPENSPEHIKNIMAQCWKSNPDERCSFEDILSLINSTDAIEGNALIPAVNKFEFQAKVIETKFCILDHRCLNTYLLGKNLKAILCNTSFDNED